MNFGLVRTKVAAPHPKNFFKLLLPLFIGFLVSIIGQSSLPPVANALYFGTGYNAAVAGNAGGGNQNGVNACATDMVAVGVGLTVNGSSPGFGVYCRAIGADGQLVAQDQSSAANTTAVGGGNNKVFCPAGKVVTGISFIIWTNVAIRCATPPSLSDNSALIWFTATTSTPASTNCSANGIVAGFFTRTGAWTDAIGAYCLPYSLNTLSYNINGGGGSAPASQTQTAPAQTLTVSSSYTGTRTGFHFDGWNTQANGYGTDYATGSSIRPIGATTLYAKWTSTITYNGNSNTGGSVPNSTTAVSSAASTFLAPNDGSSVNPNDPLVKTGFTFAGWNTQANGAGTLYVASNPTLVTETPYMWFDAANFDDTTNAWTDTSGNSRSIPGTAVTSATAGSIRGNPTKATFTGVDVNGLAKSFPVVQGATTDGIVIGNGALTNYTFCHVARYTGTNRNRIFAGTAGNWLSGFWSSATGVAHHEGWITASTGTNDLNWKIQCDTGGSRSSLRSDGVLKSSVSTNATGLPANISINLQGSRNAPAEVTDWAVAEFIIYDSVLSEEKIKEIEERLNRKYKVGLFTPSIHTYNYASTGDITLYAQWNSTITYDGNGQTSASSTVPAPTIAKGTAANTALANAGTMVKTGYTFGGWNTQADGSGTNYASGLTTYQSAGNITLYAKWTRTITYNTNGANSGTPERTTDVFVNATTPTVTTFPTVGSMVRTGFTFGGWSTTTTGAALTTPYVTTSEIILYARWSANNYAVTFDANGGSGTMANLAIVAGTAKTLTANTFARTGYTFAGWNTAADGSGTSYPNSQSVTLYANTTLFAQWTAGTFAVTFGSNTATGSTLAAGNMPNQSFKAGTPFNLSANVWYKTGFIFAGWSATTGNSTVIYTDQQQVTLYGATTIYAQWTPVYVVSYSANATAGTFTGTTPASTNSVGGAEIVVAKNSGNLAKSGLTFAGWNTKADGTGKTYFADSKISPTSNTILYAMYLSACSSTSTTANGYVVLTFSGVGNCLWTTPAGVTSIDLLAVGGGGGGGSSLGGGGGGGQVVYETGVTSVGTAIISVAPGGTGGAGSYTAAQNHGKTGAPSSFNTPTVSKIALGGSGGNGRMSATNLNPDGTAISSGWTGGGGAYANPPAEVAIAGAGGINYIGGTGSGNGGAGGGGAGGVGVNSVSGSTAAGGVGVSNSINGTSVYYGGGGGGGKYSGNASWTGVGGIGGGGNGSTGTNVALNGNGNGSNGATNTGGGGGGGYDGGTGGNGGSGIVILRYAYGTPSAPVITSVTGSANKLTVAFTPPASDGGSAITNYEYSLDGGITWTVVSPTDSTSPLEITKLANGTTTLTNGTTYQVAIRALNGKTGLASNVVAGTTPLSPPTISAVAGNASATVTVGAAAGESPTSFTVTALNDSGVALSPAKTCTVTSPASSCLITGLTNGITYKFSAVANLGSQVSTATVTATGVAPAAPIVTYDANGGTVGPSNTSTVTAEFNAGTPVVHPLPVRTGYNFTGWYNASNTLIGQNGSNYEPAATITLTARWAGITYSISYNGNGNTGGAVPATGSYVNGSGTPYVIVANTGSLTKTGYTFDSWVDGAGTSKSGNYSTGADLLLFAKWTPNQFTVSYDTASGGTAPANQSYTYGTTGLTIDSGSSLSKSGYTFLGWSKTPTGTTVSSPFIPTADTTLYARWSGQSYSVAFNSNGGSVSPSTASFTTGGAGITLPSAGTLAGYNFAGWSETLNGTVISGAYSATENITLYAKWTPIQYNITYNRGSIGSTTIPATGQLSNFPSNSTSTISTVITLDSTIDTSTVLSNTTYVFTGWKESGTNAVYKGGDAYRMSASDVTFTAQWVAVYTVSYILNGGSGSVPADVTRTDQFSESLTTVVPTRAGFTFSKWVDQKGLDVTSIFTVNADRYLLYAVWTPDVYTITYVPGTSVTGTVSATTGGYKESITLASDSTLSYTNYKFLGWKIGTTIYSAGGNYVLSGNVNAEAQWESTLSQIFYDINGGTGTAAPSIATQNQAVTLPLVGTFSRAGYALAGWIGGGVTTPAATYTNTTTNSVTLIAQWTLLAPAIPSAPTAVAGSGSATVTVNPATGGGPADSYVVTALDSSGNPLSPAKSCTVYAPSTSCVISGLEDGTSYKFATTATNSAGTSTSSPASSSVIPAGKPSIVTGVSATASNASAIVRFTAPATTGGAPIVSYTVTASTGQICVITPTFPDPLGCTVSGLTNGTAVTFTVQANNGAYTSDSSTATIAVTPATVPAAPTGVTSTSSAPGKATITFTAPTDNGGSAITEYIVTSSPGGLACTTTNPSTGCEITGLTNGTAYTFTAVAKNSVGNSSNSTPSAAVTPVGKPSTPTNIVATAGNASASISFTAPNNGGSAITRYDVEAYDEYGVAISPALTCTLNVPFPTPLICTFANSLVNGVKYTFKVSATNTVGTSDSSTATSVITPANLIAPSVAQVLTPTGETTIGSVLTSSVLFGGVPTPTISYIWERCTSLAATSCTTIVGATSDTYTTTSADDGLFVRYKATGQNTAGSVVATSATTAKITGNPVVSTPTTGLSGTTGSLFTLATAVSGGSEPYTFAISTGTLPAGLTIDSVTGTISGTPTASGSSTITLLVADAKGKTGSTSFTIAIAAAASNATPEPAPEPEPVCGAVCQAANNKAAADAAAKAAADKAIADAAAKVKADAAATSASSKAAADAAAAAAAAKAAVDKAAAAALAQAAADAAAKAATAQAKAAADAQAAAAKAAADAAAALKNATATAAAKAAATKAANTAAATAAAAVKAAATAAQQAATAKTTAANATKQVDIAINSLTSKTAASQASAQANAIAAAAKAAADEAAKAAADAATAAKANATAAQKAAADTAARIAIEQKQAADAAAQAKIAADAAAKATADKIAAEALATKAAQDLAKVLADKATLAEQAAKTTDETARAEIQKKIEEVTTKVEEVQKSVEIAIAKAETAAVFQQTATQIAETATKEAQTQAAEAVAVKAESVAKTAAATKAVAAASVAAKVATAAKEAAAKVPSKAVIATKPSTSTNKNSATATVTGLKPGQKVKVTVNVKGK